MATIQQNLAVATPSGFGGTLPVRCHLRVAQISKTAVVEGQHWATTASSKGNSGLAMARQQEAKGARRSSAAFRDWRGVSLAASAIVSSHHRTRRARPCRIYPHGSFTEAATAATSALLWTGPQLSRSSPLVRAAARSAPSTEPRGRPIPTAGSVCTSPTTRGQGGINSVRGRPTSMSARPAAWRLS